MDESENGVASDLESVSRETSHLPPPDERLPHMWRPFASVVQQAKQFKIEIAREMKRLGLALANGGTDERIDDSVRKFFEKGGD